MTNLERIRKELGPARRKKVAARAAQLPAHALERRQLDLRGKTTTTEVLVIMAATPRRRDP